MSTTHRAGLLAASLLAAAGCAKEKESERQTTAASPTERAVAAAPPAAAPTPPPSAAVAVVPAAGDHGAGKITLSVTEPSTAPAAAMRCALGGDPLVVPCVGSGTLAVTPRGALYLTGDGGTVRRYRRAAGEGCTLELDASFGAGGTLTAPDKAPKPQTLGKGPVYMRSGGPDWQLAADGDTVYLYDLLLGLYRVDRGSAQPVCPDLQGLKGLAIDGGTAISSIDGGTRLALGKKCKASPVTLDPKPRFGVHAVGDAAWGQIASGKLVRYGKDGAAAATIGGDDAFAPGGLCSTSAVSACGDDVCVLDGNCQKLSRFAADGTHVLERKADQLLGDRPYGFSALAPADDGGLWLLARHKDGETCEAALYLVPGAALRP